MLTYLSQTAQLGAIWMFEFHRSYTAQNKTLWLRKLFQVGFLVQNVVNVSKEK